MNWYKKSKRIFTFAEATSADLPYIEAQQLLQQIAIDMPSNHPLKDKAYIAGGTVRDEIMGKIPKDIDICVAAPEDDVLHVLKHRGFFSLTASI